VLPDGDALVVGGDTVPSTEETYGASRAERLDLASGQWTPAGIAPRLLVRQATSLGDGTVLAIGPSLNRSGSSSETDTLTVRYLPSTRTWQSAGEAAWCDNLHSAEMTLTALADDSVLVAGRGECAGGTRSWAARKRVGENPVQLDGFAERGRHAAVRLADGRVLLTGGAFGGVVPGPDCCPPFEVRATAELFTP
jgi:hypothetical protein